MQHDGRHDAARDDVERHHDHTDDGGADDAGDALIEVQTAEQQRREGDGCDRAPGGTEYESGDGEAECELFDDAGINRQQRPEPHLLPVAWQHRLDVADRHDAIVVTSGGSHPDPREHHERDHQPQHDRHHDEGTLGDSVPDAAHPRPRLQLRQKGTDVRAREQQHHDRDAAER